MEQFDQTLRRLAHEEEFPLPEDYAGKIFALCAALEEKTIKTRSHKTLQRWLVGVAAALAVFIAIPNLSAPAAAAMSRIPLLGPVVKVITFRHYTYENDHAHADVSVPEVQGGEAASSVNAEVQKYTDQLIEKFKEDCKTLGEGYEGLDVTYHVVTDTDGWFTLRVDALETMASGYEFSRIYNIDKGTGKIVPLGGLFRPGTDWQTVLTGEVKTQMDAQMAADAEIAYFEDEFTGVAADRNYYFNADGNLVLAFDEYEVAPGSMGAVEFTIEKSVYQDLLK